MENSKSDGMIRHLNVENDIDEIILTQRCECRLNVGNDDSNSKNSIIETKGSVNYECWVDQHNSASCENDEEDNTGKK
jgi:hypothetical protein